mmetsp:Transcript_12585/g.57156  ORF Transcript_12585/g.57156 Transcript_12585/m.57156 type:complete len:232 (+) Transcript_12585:852-1547(+)
MRFSGLAGFCLASSSMRLASSSRSGLLADSLSSERSFSASASAAANLAIMSDMFPSVMGASSSPEAARTSREPGVRALDESYPLALNPGSKRGAAAMTNAMLVCASEWSGPRHAAEDKTQFPAPSKRYSTVRKNSPMEGHRHSPPLCRVHALTLVVDASPVRLQEVQSAYGSDRCSRLRCYPACLHEPHRQESSPKRRRSRCHRAPALHRERGRRRRRGRQGLQEGHDLRR